MNDKAKAVLASYDGEPTAVGYALVLFHEDGTFSLDAEVGETNEDALEAIAEIAMVLGCDAEQAVIN
jgi:hypothetical protein